MSIKTCDFTYRQIKFHINDNANHNEYEGKYKLLWYNVCHDRWQFVGTCDTLKEAKQIAKDFF